ncbi:MAG TPA: toast rack family protein [Anaerolineaceae bacterium]|nr:toast rack family protein [Anaerolineaceae bacterium]
MKRWFLTSMILSLLALSACMISFDNPQVVDTISLTVSEPAPGGTPPLQLRISMGTGTLNLTGGAELLLEGEIRYNVNELKPEFTRQEGSLQVIQSNKVFNILSGNKIVNDWTLKLGNTPLNLVLEGGASTANIDLSGVPLAGFKMTDGASTTRLKFTSPNPQRMSLFEYVSGASGIDLIGLGYANFQQLRFAAGAGSYNLDFSGPLSADASAMIDSDAASVTISVPASTRTRITITGELTNVTISGAWNAQERVYENSGSGPLLDISVDMNVGTLKLINQ